MRKLVAIRRRLRDRVDARLGAMPLLPTSVMDRAAAIDAFHRFIIEKADGTTESARGKSWAGQSAAYSSKKDPKALVACLSWRDATPTSFPGRFWFRTGSSANPPASPKTAVSQAMEFCVKSGCARDACILVDLNGHNAMQPPADWPGATAQRSAPATAAVQAPAVAQTPGVAAKDVFERIRAARHLRVGLQQAAEAATISTYVNRVIDAGSVQRDEMSGAHHARSRDRPRQGGGARAERDIDWRDARRPADRQHLARRTQPADRGGSDAGWPRKVISGGRASAAARCLGPTSARRATRRHNRRPPSRPPPRRRRGRRSVKAVFERYGLLGTFAWDCSKPASEDNSNWYYGQSRGRRRSRAARLHAWAPNTRKMGEHHRHRHPAGSQ